MAQHDYVIANASGGAVRADINTALGAIVTSNSGSSEPDPTYPYQRWADTNAGLMKLRNGANNGWIPLYSLSAGGAISSSALVLKGNDATSPIRFQDGAGNEIGSVSNAGVYAGTGVISTGAQLTLRGNNVTAPIRFQDGSGNEIGSINNQGVYAGTGVTNTGSQLTLRGNNVTAPIRFQDGSGNEIGYLNNLGVYGGTGIRSTSQLVLRGDNVTAPIRFQDGSANEIGYLNNSGVYGGTGIRSTIQLTLRGDNATAPIRLQDGAGNEIAQIDNAGSFKPAYSVGSARFYPARAWASFLMSGGTITIRGSGNVSSITDTAGTGTYTVNFTTAMHDTNYAMAFTGYEGNNPGDATLSNPINGWIAQDNQATGFFVLLTKANTANTLIDGFYHDFAIFR